MGHQIHKHMSSGQRYDDKQAYNKKLSSKARLHYLENEEHDKGVSRYEEGVSRKGNAQDHMMTSGEYSRHVSSNSNSTQHHGKAPSRKSSPANNIPYGDISGKTGYMGEAKYDMEYNAVDDITQGKGKADYGVSRKYKCKQ